MKPLNRREKALLLLCFVVIFGMGNLIAFRHVRKVWGGGTAEIRALENELADLEMWLEEAPRAEAKDRWLRRHTPYSASMTKAQGDLLQSLQDDLFERKIEIENQSLQEPEANDFFQETAVSLRVKGNEKDVIEWLTTLQGPDKFQVIKSLNLELDRKSRETEPQAICQIVIARWFAPPGAVPEEEKEDATREITEEPDATDSGPPPAEEDDTGTEITGESAPESEESEIRG